MNPLIFVLSFVALASSVLCATINVHVSDHSGNLVFHPHYAWASPGDQVRFTFWPKNHTVTQSSFSSPCVKLSDGFDTGFVPVTQEQSDYHQRPWRIFNVTDTNPKWFYCRQKGHCGSGMVFAINPQDGQFDTFKLRAIQQNGTAATNSSTAVTPKACAATDDDGSSLLNESGLVNGLFTCLYQSSGTCQYFTDGSFSSGASACPDSIPGQKGLDNSGSSSTSTTSTATQCPSQDQQQSSLISESDASEGFVACTYTTARICTYFKADGSFSSGSSDCPGKITGSSNTSNASGALADSDSNNSSSLSTLVRNSWIILGLTAGILVLLIVFAFVTIASRKGLRGREAKYSKVSVPKAFQEEEESMTHKRYDEM